MSNSNFISKVERGGKRAAPRQCDLRSVVPVKQHSGADHNDPLALHRSLGADVPAGQYGEEPRSDTDKVIRMKWNWNKLNFIFCHGWGLDQRMMQPLAQTLRQYFPESQHFFYDLGFTGKTNIPEYQNNTNHSYQDLRKTVLARCADADSTQLVRQGDTTQSGRFCVNPTYIAIGHSYGFAFLTQQPWPWSAMIAINGFTHFCKLPGKKYGLPLPILDSTYTRLHTDPQATIQEFHQRCGLTKQSIYANANQFISTELAETLLVLRELMIQPPTCPILALATTHDKIAPPELTNECFALSQIDLKWFPGNHLSLLTTPDHCAHTIAHFVTQLYV